MLTRILDHIAWRAQMYERDRLRRSMKSMGDTSVVRETVVVSSPENCEIGERTWINWMTVIYAAGGVSIGSDVHIGANCTITSVTHPTDSLQRRCGAMERARVRIEDGVWLGAGAIILPGVTIGQDAIVGAGAVVTADVAPETTVVGVPARLLAPGPRR